MMISKYQYDVLSKFKEHKQLEPQQARLLDWTLGITGEAGEVVELVKHHIFSGEKLDKMKMAKELGDIVWYITALAATCNIDLADIFALNTAKLEHRYPTGAYRTSDSTTRRDAECRFEDTPEYKELYKSIMGGAKDDV